MNYWYYLPEETPLRIKISKNIHVDPHNHNFFELVYVLEGKAVHIRNGRDEEVSEGDYFILSPNDVHGYCPSRDASCRVINCCFRPEFLDPPLRGCTDLDALIAHPLIGFANVPLITHPSSGIYHDYGGLRQVFLHIFDEYADDAPGSAEAIRACLLMAMITLLRSAAANTDKTAHDLTHRLIAYIEAHAAEDCTLADAAATLSYSPPYLSRRFKQDTGRSFSDHLREVRIRRACSLLRNTDLSIEAIANQVGYADMKHFHRLFRLETGTTPHAYRIDAH